MAEKQIFALLYDFDKTLSPKDMQEYAFIPEIGMNANDFWGKCKETELSNNMDQILAYMYVMREMANDKFPLTREKLMKLGKDVKLFDGLQTWFKRINDYILSKNMIPEHYIISSGLKEIIEGTSIADEFKMIYAAEFMYNNRGEACWPAMAVNYTSKTQFMFRINKGILPVTQNAELNSYMPKNKRRVPFKNMIYIGDGLTDVPCMKLVRVNSGHSIAVYQDEIQKPAVNEMIVQGRVDFVRKADYSKNGPLEKTVFAIIDKVYADNILDTMHHKNYDRAQKEILKID